MNEEWRPVVGFESLYEVSSLGNVRSLPLKKLCKTGIVAGYPALPLTKDGRQYNRYVHRLVAEAFVPMVSGCPWVNHIDGNKRNSVASNLEWCDASHNGRHAYATGLRSRANAKMTIETARAIKKDLAAGLLQKAVASKYGIHLSSVKQISRGSNWKTA